MSLLVSCVSVSDRVAVAGGALPAAAAAISGHVRRRHRAPARRRRPPGPTSSAASRTGEPARLGTLRLPRCPRTRPRQPWIRHGRRPLRGGRCRSAIDPVPRPAAPTVSVGPAVGVAPPSASAHAGPPVCLAGTVHQACRQPRSRPRSAGLRPSWSAPPARGASPASRWRCGCLTARPGWAAPGRPSSRPTAARRGRHRLRHRQRHQDLHRGAHPAAGRGGQARPRRALRPLLAGRAAQGQRHHPPAAQPHERHLQLLREPALPTASRGPGCGPCQRPGLLSREHAWTYDEIMDLVKTGYCKPGACYHYSNTNYVILGRIAEAVGGAPLHEQLRQRFFEPLGMTDTVLPAGGAAAAGCRPRALGLRQRLLGPHAGCAPAALHGGGHRGRRRRRHRLDGPGPVRLGGCALRRQGPGSRRRWRR